MDNYQHYLKLDLSEPEGKWAIVIGGEIIITDEKNLKTELEKAKIKHSNEIPFVTKISEKLLRVI